MDQQYKEALVRLGRIDPASPALIDLARAHLEDQEPEKAAGVAAGVLRAHPAHLEAACLLARAEHALGHKQEARRVLGGLTALIEKQAETFTELAWLMDEAGLAEEAAALLKASQALMGQAPPPSLPPSEAETRSGQPAPAEKSVATLTMAELYMKQGFMAEAGQVLARLLEEDPDNQDLKNRLAALDVGPQKAQARRRLAGRLTRLKRASARLAAQNDAAAPALYH